MGKLKRMDQVKLIIKAYLETSSIKATARRLGVSRNTVRGYVNRAKDFSDDLRVVLQLPEEELLKLVYSSVKREDTSREAVFNNQIGEWIKQLSRTGVNRYSLWEEYKKNHPDGYSYSQFCERFKREIGRRDLTINLEHKPGECMQVDFAGKKMSWVNADTGEVHDCQILVAVMPYSQQTFVYALSSQKVHDFIEGLNQALLFFGKLPEFILSDNLKSYVVKSDRYDPEFNELCVQLASHYNIDLKATRVRKPKDKASVENAVKIIYSRIYAPLQNETYHSLNELNVGIRSQLIKHNNRPYQKRAGCRQETYEREELPVMRDLPSELFEVKKITTSKVRRDYHVFIGEEKNYYSVPFQYVGRATTIIYNSKMVEVYIDNERIAIHDRLDFKNAYRHQTNPEHMPKGHSEWKKARGFNAAYFLQRAQKIGPHTRWAVGEILLSRIHETQSYNSCHGIFRLVDTYSRDRLESACARCEKVGKVSLSMLRRILLHKLDQFTDDQEQCQIPFHDNIRGPEAYQ